jgi:hypothetical protein
MSSAIRAAWLRAARERTVVGARLALEVLLLVTSAAVVWLLAMWSVGALIVYADSPEDEPVARSGALQPQAAQAPQAPQREDEYAFDGLPRELHGAPACPDIGLTEYAGGSIRLLPVARVAAPFRERLVQLEQAVRETALQLYGRAPSALLIAASYDCRPVTGNRSRLSEHALGNAIDITAFRFDADAVTGEAAFDVRIDRHWNARGDALVERHARFLRTLTQTLIERNVFRTLLGPAHPDHQDHFHFDMAPRHYVSL